MLSIPLAPLPLALRRLSALRPRLSQERLALLVSLYFTAFANDQFWQALLSQRDWSAPHTWLLAVSVSTAVTALHFLLLLPLLNRWSARPLLSLLVLITAPAAYYMRQYAVFLDVSMLRNVLETDVQESRELLSPGLLLYLLLYGVLPALLVWRVRLARRSLRRALPVRLGWAVAAVGVVVAALLPVYQDLSSVMRNHKEMRYLITPGNYIVGLVRLGVGESRADGPRRPVGLDARVADRAAGARPRLLVVVVGETARAANWGLNGYARQTTPELAGLDVVNFTQVSACGSSTAVSLPCMFSAVGRRDYDEARIRGSESLLHVLDHAGVATLWRDNQSGCKGVCDGLPAEMAQAAADAPLCADGRCFDGILLEGLAERIAASPGDLVVVLHQLGNHGPAYYQRYPKEFRRFLPACENPELRACSREEIVNAYDNALLYTDHLLARTIALLKAQRSHDAAMIYVSDHGESLGEQGLYLHGLPWLIAPSEQVRVPMVAWLSPQFAAQTGLDLRCLRRRAAEPAAHDHLFHTVLGLLDVRSEVYTPGLDLTAGCRPS